MEDSLFAQVLSAPLPMNYQGEAVVNKLKILAGYIKLSFPAEGPETLPRVTVKEVTPLGKTVARYFGSTYGLHSTIGAGGPP